MVYTAPNLSLQLHSFGACGSAKPALQIAFAKRSAGFTFVSDTLVTAPAVFAKRANVLDKGQLGLRRLVETDSLLQLPAAASIPEL